MSARRKALLALLPVLCVSVVVLVVSLGASNDEAFGKKPSQSVEATTDTSSESIESVLDSTNIKVRLTMAVEEGGAEAGVEEFKRIIEEDPFSVSICHGMYEHIGREATKLLGRLPDYKTSECQFGFIHGALYALAGKYDTMQALVAEVDPYCRQFYEDRNAALDARGSCYHGLGHLVAAMYPNEPLAAIGACSLIDELDQHICVDGVLMEYGEDELVRTGWMMVGTHDNNDIETKIELETVKSMCAEVPQYALVKCYARLWMFLGPAHMPSLEKGEVICNTSPTREAYERCHEGFGEFAALVDLRRSEYPWPPATQEEAIDVSERMAYRCKQHQEEAMCLTGAIVSTIAHLYALDLEPEVIPNPCKFASDAIVVSQCEESMRRARELNWGSVAAELG